GRARGPATGRARLAPDQRPRDPALVTRRTAVLAHARPGAGSGAHPAERFGGVSGPARRGDERPGAEHGATALKEDAAIEVALAGRVALGHCALRPLTHGFLPCRRGAPLPGPPGEASERPP